MNTSVLRQYGIDYEKGLARCMGDADFYAQLLALFLSDDAFDRAKAAHARHDHKALFECMHEMKGACGNIDLTALYDEVCPLVELLRHQTGTDAQIDAAFARVEAAFIRAREGVALALGK